MTAVRHTFKNRKPLALLDEQLKYFGEMRGTDYHKAMPIPRMWLADWRQVAPQWTAALTDALPSFLGGLATAYHDIFMNWYNEAKRLEKSKQAANEVYERNE